MSFLGDKLVEPLKEAMKSLITLDSYEREFTEFFGQISLGVDPFVAKVHPDRTRLHNLMAIPGVIEESYGEHYN